MHLLIGQAFALVGMELTIDVWCVSCGATTAQRQTLYSGCPVDWLSLPDDWRTVDGRVYCPQHTVTIDDIPSTPEEVKHAATYVNA